MCDDVLEKAQHKTNVQRLLDNPELLATLDNVDSVAADIVEELGVDVELDEMNYEEIVAKVFELLAQDKKREPVDSEQFEFQVGNKRRRAECIVYAPVKDSCKYKLVVDIYDENNDLATTITKHFYYSPDSKNTTLGIQIGHHGFMLTKELSAAAAMIEDATYKMYQRAIEQ